MSSSATTRWCAGQTTFRNCLRPMISFRSRRPELWQRILTHYLPLYFPEADRFHRSSRSDWFFAFLERYPSPHFISAMSKDACIADAWDVVGRKVAKERLLADTYEISKVSVGLPVGLDSDAISMVRLVLGGRKAAVSSHNAIKSKIAPRRLSKTFLTING